MLVIENKSDLLYANLDKLVEQGHFENKKIILFGLNTSSYVTKKYLEGKEYTIYAYVDNNEKKVLESNEMLMDILPRHIPLKTYQDLKTKMVRAYAPEALLSEYMEDVAILIASKYYPSMCRQLEQMGYKENVHIFKTLDFYGIDDITNEESSLAGMTLLDESAIRKIQLEITVYLKELCKKHGLKYYMTGGTLLGAVRHKGYIPWDDDIDITIPMPDYKKLIELIIEDDKYDVFSTYNEPDTCSYFYMKIMDRNTVMKLWEYPFLTTSGVSIDVFPLIGLPKRMDETRKFFNRVRHLNTVFSNSFLEAIEADEEMREYRRNLREQVVSMIEQYNYYESENTGYILSKYWEKDIMPRAVYSDEIEMEFEDITLAAPVGYAEYLERIFGDYMQLPPKKEQYVTHNYNVYSKAN